MPYWPQHIILDVYIQFYWQISTSPGVASSANFFCHTIPLGNLWFWVENRGQFLGDFFSRNLYYVVLIIPLATFRSVWVTDYRQKKVSSLPRHLILIKCYPQFSGQLVDMSESYWPQQIILDVYIQFYSKFSTSPGVASSANFFRHTIPFGNLWFLVEDRGQFWGDFFPEICTM